MDTIVLRTMVPEDRDAVARILRDDTVKKTYMVPDLSEEDARKLAERIIALSRDPGRYVRGIYLGSDLVGFLNDTEIEGSGLELGWVVHPDHHNRGYATAGVKAAIAELFAMGYDRIIAGAFAENGASIRVMEKAGMVSTEKTEQIEYRGHLHRCVYYVLERSMDPCLM